MKQVFIAIALFALAGPVTAAPRIDITGPEETVYISYALSISCAFGARPPSLRLPHRGDGGTESGSRTPLPIPNARHSRRPSVGNVTSTLTTSDSTKALNLWVMIDQ